MRVVELPMFQPTSSYFRLAVVRSLALVSPREILIAALAHMLTRIAFISHPVILVI